MKKSKLVAIKLNSYVAPDPQSLLVQTQRYLTNGPDNSYFYTVEKAYLGSPTNQAIIDNYANYIMGEGLYDESGTIDISKFIRKEDQRLAITDFKIHGACAFQVIYKLDGTISRLYYIPTKTLAPNREQDITDDPTGYWYSFDWQLRSRFRPKLYPAFGYGDKRETEILYIKRHSPQPIFALPDWQSGIQYCQLEEQLSNYYINHIKNNFSAGKIVNINQGIPDNDDAQEEAELAIKSQLTGTSNAGNVIVSFNENKENATTVENIEITDAYSQFQFLSEEAKTNIMLAHKVNNKILFGLPNPSGFSSAADEMVQALKQLYRAQINPSREIITDALDEAFATISPEISLKFRDFEELRTEEPQQNGVNMRAERVSLDFDGTADTANGRKLIEQLENSGKEVYLISARCDKGGMMKFARENNIPDFRVFATCSNPNKIEKIRELGITTHYDNNPDVVSRLPRIGININKI